MSAVPELELEGSVGISKNSEMALEEMMELERGLELGLALDMEDLDEL
jgi:hypothetical protein